MVGIANPIWETRAFPFMSISSRAARNCHCLTDCDAVSRLMQMFKDTE